MDIRVAGRADPRWRIILAVLVVIYCAINLVLPRLPLSGIITSYLFQPLLWGLVIWAVLRLPGYRIAGRMKTRSAITQIALLVSFLQVILYILGGIFSGFGKSPSAFTPSGIFINIIVVGTMLAGMELSRAWLVNNLGKHVFLTLAFTSLLYTLLSLPLSQIAGFKPQVQSIGFVGATLLPSLAENLLASLLALLAGPWATLAYRGLLQAFWWLCPILPNLEWALKGFIGIAAPIFGLMITRGYYISRTQRAMATRGSSASQAGWVLTAIVSVALVWFAVGLFPVHPVVVGSGSMSPAMKAGDVALVVKIPGNSARLGDIIEFRTPEKINVMHRVIKIQQAGGAKSYITRGDANSAPDTEPVPSGAIIGRVVFTIPKVGWLAAAIKGLIPD